MSMGSPTYLFDQLIFREIRERAVPVQNPRLQEPQPIEQSQAAESQWHQDCWIHRALGSTSFPVAADRSGMLRRAASIESGTTVQSAICGPKGRKCEWNSASFIIMTIR